MRPADPKRAAGAERHAADQHGGGKPRPGRNPTGCVELGARVAHQPRQRGGARQQQRGAAIRWGERLELVGAGHAVDAAHGAARDRLRGQHGKRAGEDMREGRNQQVGPMVDPALRRPGDNECGPLEQTVRKAGMRLCDAGRCRSGSCNGKTERSRTGEQACGQRQCAAAARQRQTSHWLPFAARSHNRLSSQVYSIGHSCQIRDWPSSFIVTNERLERHIELGAAAEEIELDQRSCGRNLGADFAQQGDAGRHRSAGGQQVVDEHDAGAGC